MVIASSYPLMPSGLCLSNIFDLSCPYLLESVWWTILTIVSWLLSYSFCISISRVHWLVICHKVSVFQVLCFCDVRFCLDAISEFHSHISFLDSVSSGQIFEGENTFKPLQYHCLYRALDSSLPLCCVTFRCIVFLLRLSMSLNMLVNG